MNITDLDKECKRCGYNWKSFIDTKECPKCKSYRWNEDKLKSGVKKCQHK